MTEVMKMLYVELSLIAMQGKSLMAVNNG